MNILHYSLGFPPYRTGGLTKFCMDLMKQQKKEGNNVFLLWPGRISLLKKNIQIKRHNSIEEIDNYEIINPLPVSYDEGISNICLFTDIGDDFAYKLFINDLKPDVVHIHTLMGLHKSFIDVLKTNNIKIVFTAHDFFPICPKVKLFRNNGICNSIDSCQDCSMCNKTALSFFKIYLLQSNFYRIFKDNFIIKRFRKNHRNKFLYVTYDCRTINYSQNVNEYKTLRAFYQVMLSSMDAVHFNSNLTKSIYETFFELPYNHVVNITHGNICNNKKFKKFDNQIRIRYLGTQDPAKGFLTLKSALDKLMAIRRDFVLDIHFSPIEKAPYIKIHRRYSYEDLEEIFDNTDVLVAPSLCYETFGYTVLEALSYGVPVIISGNVGAKDIIVKGAGIIIDNINENNLFEVFNNLSKEDLIKMNKIIVEKQPILQIKQMSLMINKTLYI